MATSGTVVKQSWQENQETTTGKFLRKFEEAPYVPMGIAALVGTVALGAWNIKRKGINGQKIPLSLQVIHIRVAAQTMVVGAMTLGVGYSIISRYLKNKSDPK